MLPAAPVTATRTGGFIWNDSMDMLDGETRAGLLQLGEEFLEAAQAFGQLRGRAGIGNAQRARLAEGRARHAGHALGFQQRVAEIDVAVDDGVAVLLAEGDGDVREHVESAL